MLSMYIRFGIIRFHLAYEIDQTSAFFFCGPTEPQLAVLAKDTKLESLHLEGMQFTDASAIHLQSIQTLKQLSLLDTSITEKGIADLKTSTPDVVVEVSRPEDSDSPLDGGL